MRFVTAIAERAVAASEGRALLFPTQVHGYMPHHVDFPGTCSSTATAPTSRS